MNIQSSDDEIDAPVTSDRRTVLRMLVAVPVATALAFSGRTLAGQPVLAQATPAAGMSAASPVSCAATPLASPGPAIVVHTIYDPTAKESTEQLRFDPPQVTIKTGQTITWKNDSQMPHTATCDPAQNPVEKSHPEYIELPAGAEPWGSKMLQPGDSFSHTFTVPGEYTYICIPHVMSGMRGTITVEC